MKTQSIDTFTRNAPQFIAEANSQSAPLTLTSNGKTTAYLLAPKTYRAMRKRIQLLEALLEGERDIQEHRTFTTAQAKKKLSKWLPK